MSALTDMLLAHQRVGGLAAARIKTAPGEKAVCCTCGWHAPFTERGQGYRLWAAHVEAMVTEAGMAITTEEDLAHTIHDAIHTMATEDDHYWPIAGDDLPAAQYIASFVVAAVEADR